MSEQFDQLQAYVSDIKKIVNNFSIRGSGVSGHITTGYIVNAGVGGVVAGEGTGTVIPSTHVCPHTGDISLTISGVTACVGCVSTSFFGGFSFDNIIVSVDGTYTLAHGTTGPPIDTWQLVGAIAFEYDFWSTSGCPGGTPDGHTSSTAPITVSCQETGWSISIESGLTDFFGSVFAMNPLSIPNQVTCGDDVFGLAGIATGGSAVITLL